MPTNLLEVGVDPNYWYPVCRTTALSCGRPRAYTLWRQHFVVYRDASGHVHALDDRCAHRKVALHPGTVAGCRIVCPYHGWEFEGDGSLAKIPYWEAARKLPNVGLTSYPTAERSGLVWLFPGEPGRAREVPLPDTSALDTPEWFSFCLDNVFHNHYAIGIINGMDYFHFHLHRRYQPWSELQVERVDSGPDTVVGEYRLTSTRGLPARIFKTLLGRRGATAVTETIRVHYLYPHHLAEVGDRIKVWAFFAPVEASRVDVFITMYVRASGIQRALRKPFQSLFSPLILKRIQREDAWIGVQEQRAWELHPDEPRCETNPISVAVTRLLLRKWSEHAARAGETERTPRRAEHV